MHAEHEVSMVFLRYANHAIIFFLFSLTDAHLRREVVALFFSYIQRASAAVTVARRMLFRVWCRFKVREGFEDDLEMR